LFLTTSSLKLPENNDKARKAVQEVATFVLQKISKENSELFS
jgi:hypothetical protein